MATNDKNTLYKRGSAISQNGNGAHEEDAQVNPQEQAALYVGLSAGEASRMGVWVPCSLPQYKGLSILYRLNNQTRVRRDRPDYIEPRELVTARMEQGRALKAQQALADDAPMEERLALTVATNEALRKVIQLNQAYLDEHNARVCQWLSKFVLSFDPWPFADIPQPHPEDPDSYLPLYTDLEDLYNWLPDKGYSLALVEATKNI